MKRGRKKGWRAPIKTKRVTISLSDDEIEKLKSIDKRLSKAVRALLEIAQWTLTMVNK